MFLELTKATTFLTRSFDASRLSSSEADVILSPNEIEDIFPYSDLDDTSTMEVVASCVSLGINLGDS
jgi:hypothetical protein